MRSAPLFAVAAAAVLALMLAASGSATPSGTVASGVFGTVSWNLSATDSSDGHVCLTITLLHHRGGWSTECGAIFGPAAGRADGITYQAHTDGPAPDFIVGPVIASAKTVVIALSNGKSVRTKTIAPPKGMTARIAFYAAALPCPAHATSIRGIDAAGHTVAHLAIRFLRPPGKMTC